MDAAAGLLQLVFETVHPHSLFCPLEFYVALAPLAHAKHQIVGFMLV